MNAIVAVDQNWAIGLNRDLLVSIPTDKKMFRQETTGKVIVMGRRTLESFPGARPLPNRTNIVLSKNPDYTVADAVVCHSLEELLEELKKYPDDMIYIVGGGMIYRLMLPYVDTVHVTKINHAYQADTWFPNLDEDPEWEITADSDEMTYFDLEYQFLKYERRKKTQESV